jgi:hypothetical protein
MMEEADSLNRRAFRRIPVELSLRFLNSGSNEWRLVKTCDISAQGIGLIASEKLAPNTLLETWLPVPDSGESLYSRAEVAWSKKLAPDKYRVGVNLEKPDLISRLLQMR